MNLSEPARRRGLAALMASSFFAWGGFFMVVPLIIVHYVDQLGWTAGSVGLVLAVRQFAQQGSTGLFGVLADRVGAKGLICAGMLVRAGGFAAMAGADTYPHLMLSALLTALGGGLFESPRAAAIAVLSEPAERSRYYALTGVVSGLGVTVGTQTGALLITADFALVALGGAVCYAVIFVMLLILLPPVPVAAEPRGITYGLGLAFRDRTFLRFVVLMAGFWFIWIQFSITFALAATDIAGTVQAVAWIYAVNAGVTVGLGYLLPRMAERWLSPLSLLTIGTVLTALGLGSVGLASSVPALLVSAFIIAVGSVLARPGEQTVTANLAHPAARGSYFGVAALSVAVGGGLGNYLGGVSYDFSRRVEMPALPWLLFCLLGLLTAAGLFRWRATLSRPATELVQSPGLIARGATEGRE